MALDTNPTLTGEHVVLEPLSLDHVDELVEAAADRTAYGFTEVPRGRAAMTEYIGRFLADRASGGTVPFAQRRVADGRVVGCTRFMELRRWRDRDEPQEVEIGGTWLSADAQRTPVNTEAKLLMLTHAFDTWGVWRVALCTDARNGRSRDAIERIGATFEGILRNHRPKKSQDEGGQPRDSAMYSITNEEWPGVRDALRARLRSRR